jgi:hypothetical protein
LATANQPEAVPVDNKSQAAEAVATDVADKDMGTKALHRVGNSRTNDLGSVALDNKPEDVAAHDAAVAATDAAARDAAEVDALSVVAARDEAAAPDVVADEDLVVVPALGAAEPAAHDEEAVEATADVEVEAQVDVEDEA